MKFEKLVSEVKKRKPKQLIIDKNHCYIRFHRKLVKVKTETPVYESFSEYLKSSTGKEISEYAYQTEKSIPLKLEEDNSLKLQFFIQNKEVSGLIRFFYPEFIKETATELSKGFIEANENISLMLSDISSGKTTRALSLLKYLSDNNSGYSIYLSDFTCESVKGLFELTHWIDYNEEKDLWEQLEQIKKLAPNFLFIDVDSLSLSIDDYRKLACLPFKIIITSNATSVTDFLNQVANQNPRQFKRDLIEISNLLFSISSSCIIGNEGDLHLEEALVMTAGVKKLFNDGKFTSFKQAMQVGMQNGMKTFEQELKTLLMKKKLPENDYRAQISFLERSARLYQHNLRNSD